MQDTVDKLYDDIADAIARGSSFRAIHAQLTREGHKVGKGHSSLFAAFKAAKARREQSSMSTGDRIVDAPQPVSAGAVAMTSGTAALGQMPAAIIDTRRKIDEW